jgi:hypothetical protein
MRTTRRLVVCLVIGLPAVLLVLGIARARFQRRQASALILETAAQPADHRTQNVSLEQTLTRSVTGVSSASRSVLADSTPSQRSTGSASLIPTVSFRDISMPGIPTLDLTAPAPFPGWPTGARSFSTWRQVESSPLVFPSTLSDPAIEAAERINAQLMRRSREAWERAYQRWQQGN